MFESFIISSAFRHLIKMTIRLATLQDVPTITSIYNEFIDTTVTMDLFESSIDNRTIWFQNHQPTFPITCYVNDSGKVVGWASLSKWSPKLGYKLTVENSVYVSKKYQKLGIGKKLLSDIISKAKDLHYHTIVSRIDSENVISLNLHKKYGFIEIGCMKEFGFKFNKYIDIIMLQLILE